MQQSYVRTWIAFILFMIMVVLFTSCTGRTAMVMGKAAHADTVVYMQYSGGGTFIPTDIPDTNYYLFVLVKGATDSAYWERVSRNFYESVSEEQVIKL